MRIAFLTDVHMGHPKVPANIAHDNLKRYLYPHLENIDVLLLGGDFFDDVLTLDIGAGYHATLIIDELCTMAKQRNFLIRVLRGTWSHDRHQNKFFLRTSLDGPSAKERIKVFDTLSIETLEQYGVSIMYIPSELGYDVMAEIPETLAARGLDRVDIIAHHGYFRHLLPNGMDRIPSNTLEASAIKRFAALVVNGHIHSPSVVNNVVNGGSFERCCHGEEENKGFFLIDYDPVQRSSKLEFVVNEGALTFTTLDLRQHGTEEAIDRYVKLQTALPIVPERPTYLRVLTADVVAKQAISIRAKEHLAPLYVSFDKGDEVIENEYSVDLEVIDLPVLTESNLPEHIVSYLHDNGDDLALDEVVAMLREYA